MASGAVYESITVEYNKTKQKWLICLTAYIDRVWGRPQSLNLKMMDFRQRGVDSPTTTRSITGNPCPLDHCGEGGNSLLFND